MRSAEVFVDLFERNRRTVARALEGLSPDQLAARLDADANSIAWLVWHAARTQDDHVAEVAGEEQCWTGEGWADRFGLPFAPEATGNRHTSEEVAAVQVDSADLLAGYYDAVHARTVAFLSPLSDEDFDRVVDTSYDPPVTLGVRLVSVVNDNFQHAGQAAFIRGVIERG